ncbi:MAG: diaminopimelate decarboxylase family protein, partial [Candidatus Coproplasma sp.]
IADGSALEYVKHVLSLKNIRLRGFHCHIGSQIFEKQSFVLAAEKMLNFFAEVKSVTGFEADVLNIGGGFGVWYTDEDPKFTSEDYASYLIAMIDTIKEKCEVLNLNRPYLLMEPGRSIVGEAGITLYTVGSIKDIPGIRKYIAIDGGMFENPRYSLYQSKYTAVKVDDVNAPCTQKVSIAGKCCESGDLIGVDMPMPEVKTGDIIACLTTGAYHYSMASNYNRNLIPAAVLVKDGKSDIIIKRQTYSDIVRNDVVPDKLK